MGAELFCSHKYFIWQILLNLTLEIGGANLLVELRNVSVTYSNGVDALHDVSLRINDGEFAFVVGESGAGKSTLIKLLLKEITPTSGRIMVNGFNLEKLKKSKAHKLRRTIGFVFQDFKLINTMNVYDNVAFVLRSIDAPIKYTVSYTHLTLPTKRT